MVKHMVKVVLLGKTKNKIRLSSLFITNTLFLGCLCLLLATIHLTSTIGSLLHVITWRARKTHLLTINTTNFKFEAVQEFSCTHKMVKKSQSQPPRNTTSSFTPDTALFHVNIWFQHKKQTHNKFLQETNHFLFVSRFIWWTHIKTPF